MTWTRKDMKKQKNQEKEVGSVWWRLTMGWGAIADDAGHAEN
jgi:hypothetical protein